MVLLKNLCNKLNIDAVIILQDLFSFFGGFYKMIVFENICSLSDLSFWWIFLIL